MKPTPDEARIEIASFLDHLFKNWMAMRVITARQKDYIVMFRDYISVAKKEAVEDMLTYFPDSE